MKKTILITGATDGIGLAAAKAFASQGHNLLIHGRNSDKLKHTKELLNNLADQQKATSPQGKIQTFLADLSSFSAVKSLAEKVKATFINIDVLINNAGVFKVADPITKDGLDVRFMVNTIAPYLLTEQLLPMMNKSGRVINLSSAAQAPVNIDALFGKNPLTDMAAYSQSKLAITMWTHYLAKHTLQDGPIMFPVNPGSLLASKMVKEGFGIAGNDISIGANILVRLALEEGLEPHSGKYFDNDKGEFSSPHPDGENLEKSEKLITAIKQLLTDYV